MSSMIKAWIISIIQNYPCGCSFPFLHKCKHDRLWIYNRRKARYNLSPNFKFVGSRNIYFVRWPATNKVLYLPNCLVNICNNISFSLFLMLCLIRASVHGRNYQGIKMVYKSVYFSHSLPWKKLLIGKSY